jgi:deoxycytidylate deaminase
MSKENPINQFNIMKGPEIFIGLVGPLGTDLSSVTKELESAFKQYNYTTIVIKLSEALGEIEAQLDTNLIKEPEDQRISSYMSAGTELREKLKWGGALAIMAAANIRNVRIDPVKPNHRTVYILHSIKHKKESEVLRNIYGRGYFQISVFSSEENRIDNLTERLATSNGSSFKKDEFATKARDLIRKDYNEHETKLGQNVSGAFPLADFFVNIDRKHQYKVDISRFVELLFGNPFITPTKNESGMFFARTAALRSADLSRQVGAAITNTNGDLINIGCNEVPKAGGGIYSEGEPDEEDFRDFKTGYDINTRKKKEVLIQTLQLLRETGLIESGTSSTGEIADSLLYGDNSKAFKESQIANILEYGRVVHAEMNAITDSANRGLKIGGAKLYCTTFPCHMCARHIISSGIKKVYYIEPYPKSLAEELYKHEISIDKESSDKKVSFEAFMGVSPLSYIKFFNYKNRKDKEGNKLGWPNIEQEPIVQRYFPTYIMVEEDVVENLYNLLEEKGFVTRKVLKEE